MVDTLTYVTGNMKLFNNLDYFLNKFNETFDDDVDIKAILKEFGYEWIDYLHKMPNYREMHKLHHISLIQKVLEKSENRYDYIEANVYGGGRKHIIVVKTQENSKLQLLEKLRGQFGDMTIVTGYSDMHSCDIDTDIDDLIEQIIAKINPQN